MSFDRIKQITLIRKFEIRKLLVELRSLVKIPLQFEFQKSILSQ